jgi:hypothetical protein
MRDRRAGRGNEQVHEPKLTSRRHFLRRAGITSALAAAIVGGADMAGLSSASAGTRGTNKACNSRCQYTYTPGRCAPNGGSCPSGSCCYYQCGPCCVCRYNCIAHHCSYNFYYCC